MNQQGGIRTHTTGTARLNVFWRGHGHDQGTPVLFIHGNLSTSRFWSSTLARLPDRYRAIAPDLRGFGKTEPLPIDATRGLRDFADDLHALMAALRLTGGTARLHLVGWSVGGAVALQYAIDHPEDVASIVLVNPMSPYGFGGTRDVRGTPCWPDHAGSGAGTANPDFIRRLADQDRGADSPFSPRNVMNQFYFKPPFRLPAEEEEALLNEVLTTRLGEGHYPGDVAASPNWPGVAPGTRGMNNAISPRYCNLGAFATVAPRPPVLWIRGSDDTIVSDTSLFDFGYLGQLGAVPGWPGPEVYPPQPMVSQTRALLEAFREQGGSYWEEVLPGCGHSPHLEQPQRFLDLLLSFLGER